jgi:hypothetical protein
MTSSWGAMRRGYLKFIGIALGIVLLFALAAGGFLFALLEHFYPTPPRTHYGKPLDALEAQRQDIDYFGKLIAMDRSYSPSSRAEASRRLAALSDAKAVLPRPYFRVALMKIAALADNGHTHVGIDPGAQPMELPVRVAAFSDGIYVMHATKQYGDLLGGKLVSIDAA